MNLLLMNQNLHAVSLPKVEEDHYKEVESLLYKSALMLVQNLLPHFEFSVFLKENWIKI